MAANREHVKGASRSWSAASVLPLTVALPLFPGNGQDHHLHGGKRKRSTDEVGEPDRRLAQPARHHRGHCAWPLAAGLDLATTLDAVGGGAAGSWMWSNLGPKIAAGDDRPGFSIYLHAKDLRLASEFLDDLNLEAPGTRLTCSLFRQAEDMGLGALGNQGLARLWREQQV